MVAFSIEEVFVKSKDNVFYSDEEVSTRDEEGRWKVVLRKNRDSSRGGAGGDAIVEPVDDSMHGTRGGEVHFFGGFVDSLGSGHSDDGEGRRERMGIRKRQREGKLYTKEMSQEGVR